MEMHGRARECTGVWPAHHECRGVEVGCMGVGDITEQPATFPAKIPIGFLGNLMGKVVNDDHAWQPVISANGLPSPQIANHIGCRVAKIAEDL